MISIKETAVMGHIHVCESSVAPCDDPEDQSVLTEELQGLPTESGLALASRTEQL
jgi:hypothetical protein